jgi:uncharacterized coiled-coil protein SlyX
MKNQTSLTKSINLVTSSINRACLWRAVAPVPLMISAAWFALSPQARAVCQEGCDTNSNTFLGEDALISNTVGFGNTATGWQALFFNTTGYDNTATGISALNRNTTGGANTATGNVALYYNTTGYFNTATGDGALYGNTTGWRNTATGDSALSSNEDGSSNTAVGYYALNNTGGSGNIAIGAFAGADLTTGDDNIDIGNLGVGNESNTIRIGTTGKQTRTVIAGISGATVPGGVGVIVGTTGKLGTVVSSVRFKDQIKPMDKASEAILALKPVTFRYKKELDPEGVPQFGLVAEDVEKVDPALVARDDKGKPYSVRYEAVNAMLLNEFLKEHRKGQQQDRKIEELEATIVELKSTITRQQEQINALAAGLQKVSAQIEMSTPVLQTIANNQ